MPPSFTFRPITPEDESILYRIYASTRSEELAVLDWSEQQKEEFLKMQFAAQHKFYQEQFTKARFDLILFDNKPVGRLYLDRRKDELRIIDIALLPECRNRGIGSALLRDIITEARKTAKPVRIHVEQNNPALSLYDRLGFTKIAENGVYDLMEWKIAEDETQPSDPANEDKTQPR